MNGNSSSRLVYIQRKVTNGYRTMWATAGVAHIRTVINTARLSGASPFTAILKTVGT